MHTEKSLIDKQIIHTSCQHEIDNNFVVNGDWGVNYKHSGEAYDWELAVCKHCAAIFSTRYLREKRLRQG